MNEKATQVRIMLTKNYLTYDWLKAQFEKINVKFSYTELSDILHGRRTSEKAVMVINKSIEFLDRYEKLFVSSE